MRRQLSLALLAACLAACGSEITGPASASPQQQSAQDSSLAATAMREAEQEAAAEARGVRELGWEELMPEGEEERLAAMYQQQMQQYQATWGTAGQRACRSCTCKPSTC